ncbi:MAG: hypothetical protein FJ147_17990 [Deltaproteobacteria bacterium]|nr:hypothetical protein [Deltaproteobacteria bacterium]
MHHDRRVYFFVSLFLFFVCGTPTVGESRTMIVDNPQRIAFGGFASSVAVVGDIDGDQVGDYLVGAYNNRWEKNDRQGRALTYSGKTGKLLYIIDDPIPQSMAAFGFAVAGPGDVNKDGTGDLLIGAFGQDGSGKAFVFSGKDGKLLCSVQAPQRQTGAGFGWAVTALGDLNGDSTPDFGVGAFAQEGSGRVFIFSGQDGKLLRTLMPPANSLTFGWALATIDDLNKDGLADILVGAPYTNSGKNTVQGQAYVFSGKDGVLLHTLEHPQPMAGATFGWRIDAAGDLNKDGTPDILVGAPYQGVDNVIAQGAAYAFNGATGQPLFTLANPVPRPYAAFGFSLTKSEDMNQDGVPEILVGAPYQTVDEFHVQGEVFLFNGRDGRHLTTFDNPYPHPGSSFGYTIVSPGDVNGDKIPDFAIGAMGQGIMDKPAVGRLYVFLSKP